jgi:hypothetical protein
VLLPDHVRDARGADEGEGREVSPLDERPGHDPAVAVDDVHDPRRKRVGEDLHQRRLAQQAVAGQVLPMMRAGTRVVNVSFSG